MTDEQIKKKEIETALAKIPTGDFLETAKDLLAVLGYRSELTEKLWETVNEFIEELEARNKNTKTEQEFRDNAESVELVFQVTDDEIAASNQIALFEAPAFDRRNVESFMFFAVELKDKDYSRGKYVQFIREINKRFMMPIVVLFCAGNRLTIGFVGRRPHKYDPDSDVLERATLIKDIRLDNPYRAHLDILFELSMGECAKWMAANKEPENFDGLLAAWLDRLDTEELNKQFYQKLLNWFEWAVKKAKFPTQETRVLKPEEHVIRLITRLLFVWFMKEKGLVADELFNEAQVSPLLKDYDRANGDSYYRAVLQNLFFATLNTEIEHRRFSKGTNNDHRNFSLYRYKDQISDPDELLRLFAQTPFVNGGLFDCLDSFKGIKEGGYRVDCFSDKVGAGLPVGVGSPNPYSIPNRLLFDDDGLIPLLEHYKFTVEENTPIEQEVALDPELLGKVFENLLAAHNPETGETARKQTGSYYTPRAIVDYMVEEALVATLAGQVSPTDGEAKFWDERLRYLFDYAMIFDDASVWFDDHETDEIVRAISELKILDPAVGSGAFPMGVLHKLTLALRRLDPDNSRWQQLQEERAGHRARAAFKISNQQERDAELTEISDIFERYRDSDFGRKLYLIQNGIFGVDIQPVACQIAKLRFFISLAIEQEPDETADNFGIKPLPNLETRFVAANTLIGLQLSEALPLLQDHAVQQWLKEIEAIREKYFLTNNRQQKLDLEDQEEEYRGRLKAELENQRAKWVERQEREIERKVDQLPNPKHGKQLREQEQKRYRVLKEKFDSDFEDARKIAGWKPYDQNAKADWFAPEWMFGIADGFDVVIGNPPYVDSENMTRTNPEQRRMLARKYVTAKGNWDLYIPFWELSLNLIHEGGVASLITPNKWLSINYGKSLRQFSKSFVYKIVDYSRFRVFETTGVFPVVVFMSRHPYSSIHIERYSENHNLISDQSLPVDITRKFEKWGVFLAENLDLVIAVMERGKRLSEYCDAEEAFTVSEAYELSEYLCEFSSPEHDVFKFVNTGTIDPFISLWGAKKTTYLKKKYDKPVVDRKSFRRHFEKRYIQTTCSKIIISGIRHFEAFLDKDGEWIAGKSTVILRNFRGISLELMVGILNSRLVSFFLKECFGSLAMDGGINFSPSNVSEIPIPDVSKSKGKCDDIVEMVNQIIITKSVDIASDTSDLENEIDQVVYSLYDLTADEIKIVEGKE